MSGLPVYRTFTLTDTELALLDACAATSSALQGTPVGRAIPAVRSAWQWPRGPVDRLFLAAWNVIAAAHQVAPGTIAPHPDGLPYVLGQSQLLTRATRGVSPTPTPTPTPQLEQDYCEGNCSRGGDGPPCRRLGCRG